MQDHPFWTSPLFFWSIPQELRSHFAQSSLVFIKG
ncbi:MAG: ARMT1-like domain-containing protein [Cyanobacteria bacterium J06558_2]